MTEQIICAAIWIQDETRWPNQPVDFGRVIGGHRHHNCLHATIDIRKGLRGRVAQGFLTSAGRYVSRSEAWEIAMSANQIIRELPSDHTKELYSENIY